MQDRIVLRNITGYARHLGNDEHGNAWIEFEMDAFAGETLGECALCGVEIESGWLCLDGGDEVCADHIEVRE